MVQVCGMVSSLGAVYSLSDFMHGKHFIQGKGGSQHVHLDQFG